MAKAKKGTASKAKKVTVTKSKKGIKSLSILTLYADESAEKCIEDGRKLERLGKSKL